MRVRVFVDVRAAGAGDAVVFDLHATRRQFVQNAGSNDVTLRIIPGADHIFDVLTDDPSASEQVLEITTAWMGDKL